MCRNGVCAYNFGRENPECLHKLFELTLDKQFSSGDLTGEIICKVHAARTSRYSSVREVSLGDETRRM